MATKSKKTPSYDLKAADRRRNMMIRIGLTSIVIIFAVAVVGVIVLNKPDKVAAGESKSIRVASSALVTKPGTTDPKVVLQINEDFLCPACGRFEQQFGPTVSQLIKSGAVAADFYMLAILDRATNQNYSSRAGATSYCVADEDKTPDKEVFTRFHAALYAQQPDEGGSTFPTDAQLIETARQAGAAGSVPDCVKSGRYLGMVGGLATAQKITSTPTIRINGEDYQPTTPDALVAKIKEIVGDVPGLTPAPAAPAPTPPAAPPTRP